MVNHIVEQSYHGALIGCPNILQPKWHHFVIKSSPLCDEGCFLHVFGCHLDRIVSIESVHEGEDLMLHGVVDQNMDVWKWEVVFGARPVQILVVYMHMYLSVFLWVLEQYLQPIEDMMSLL